MATTPTYRFLRDAYNQLAGEESYACYSASGINTGDMCQWDPGALVATANLLASGSIFLGISDNTNPVVGLGTPGVPLTGGRVTIKSSGIFTLKCTNGETYTQFVPVYQGADQQTVTTGPSSNRMIGRVWLPDGSTVTGTTSNTVPVMIYGSMTNDSKAPSALTGDR